MFCSTFGFGRCGTIFGVPGPLWGSAVFLVVVVVVFLGVGRSLAIPPGRSSVFLGVVGWKVHCGPKDQRDFFGGMIFK